VEGGGHDPQPPVGPRPEAELARRDDRRDERSRRTSRRLAAWLAHRVPRRPRDEAGVPVGGWQGWLALLGRPARRTVLLGLLALVVEYLVVPELVGARHDLALLGHIDGGWVAAGVVLEAVSLFCYGLLTRELLPPTGRPGIFTLFRVDLAAAAVAHVIPAGTLGSAGVGYRLFTAEGVSGVDAGVMMTAKGLGSTVVLNVLLWVSLVVSIPLAGFHPIYVTVAGLGAVALLGVGLLVLGVTRGTDHLARAARAVERKVPRLGNRLEGAVRQASSSLAELGRDRRVVVLALVWASLNWLLDAASLWCFLAAFGARVDPFELFAAYGIANVAGALPITPGGLGVVDSIAPLLLVSFGVTRGIATLGVLGWRLVNFWMPIPVGAAAYVSLKIPASSDTGSAAAGSTQDDRNPDRPDTDHLDPDRPDLTEEP
jgi:uncharacterized protein (TIRG00374 family)